MNPLDPIPFLDALFKEAPAGHFLELRAYTNPDLFGHKRIHREFIKLPVNPNRVHRFIDRHEGEWHIAFSCAPRSEARGKEDAVGVLTALWAEIDFKQYPHLHPQEIYDGWNGFQPQPTFLNFSGHGLHGYWLLDAPAEIHGRPEEFRQILKGLQTALLGDTQNYDLSRLFRLPGTYNVKDPRHRKRCRVVRVRDVRYPPNVFARFKPPEPTPHDRVLLPAGVSPQVDRVLALVRSSWTEGRRHRLALGLAGYLRKAGWSEARARAEIEAICAQKGDADLDDRRNCVRDTFKCPLQSVSGITLINAWM